MDAITKAQDSDCKFVQGVFAGEDMERTSRALKAIAHPLRLQILCCLGGKQLSVQDIVNHVGTSQSNISQHLGVMRSKGVVDSNKVANRVFYRVSNETILQMMGIFKEKQSS